jgi:hypothetical protein
MEFIFNKGLRQAQSYPSPAPWSFALALGCSIFMDTKIPAFLDFHLATFLVQSRLMGKSLSLSGHPSIIFLEVFEACPWFIDRKYWMHI